MTPIDLGPCPHHAFTETYCTNCGVPESSNQHGMDCLEYPQQGSPAAVSSAATGLADPRKASRE